jgi:hypothetical protein
VVLGPKKVGNPKKKKMKTVYEPKKKLMCHEIEPNPSKDRAMHEGDNMIYCILEYSIISIRCGLCQKQIEVYCM